MIALVKLIALLILQMEHVGLGLGLEGTHVLVTGAAGLIGRVTVAAFLEAGCSVSAVDISSEKMQHLEHEIALEQSRFPVTAALSCHVADITSATSLDKAASKMYRFAGPIQCCVALASLDLSVLPHHESILDMPLEQFKQTLEVNVTGTFLTAKFWLQHVKEVGPEMGNRSLILVGSESGSFGERTNPDYACSKSAVQGGLLQSLKAQVPRIAPGARVNAIAPGPVNTVRFKEECRENPDQYWLDAQAT